MLQAELIFASGFLITNFLASLKYLLRALKKIVHRKENGRYSKSSSLLSFPVSRVIFFGIFTPTITTLSTSGCEHLSHLKLLSAKREKRT